MEAVVIKRLIAAVFVLGALSACASTKYVVSDVTRFHTMLGSSSDQTFAIVAANEEQKLSLAFKQYADQLNSKLSALGLKQYAGANGPAEADLVVTLKYNVTGPSPDVEGRGSHSNFSYGYGYYGRPFGYGAMLAPYDRTDTTQLFVRRVELDMYKGSTYGAEKQERVFEGRAVSQGRNGHVEAVMPYVLDAILENFPGTSGKTHTVSVAVPPDVELPASASSRPRSRSSY
jgi:hypothetical protein